MRMFTPLFVIFTMSVIIEIAVASPPAKPDPADKITEVEALRYENAWLKARAAQQACEAACAAQLPDYGKATKALQAEVDAIVKEHKMDVSRGDKFDLETRIITRAPPPAKKTPAQ